MNSNEDGDGAICLETAWGLNCVWPHCDHMCCVECTIHYDRSYTGCRNDRDGVLPTLPAMRFLPCPLCRKAFGIDAAAQEQYGLMHDAARSMNLPDLPQRSTFNFRLARPLQPQGIFPLCHHNHTHTHPNIKRYTIGKCSGRQFLLRVVAKQHGTVNGHAIHVLLQSISPQLVAAKPTRAVPNMQLWIALGF